MVQVLPVGGLACVRPSLNIFAFISTAGHGTLVGPL
jgi:hypothetical protein